MERQSQKTKLLLQQALLALLETKTYQDIRIQDITDCAEVSRATFYLHFADKNGLFVSAYSAAIQKLAATILTTDELIGVNLPPSHQELYEYHWRQRNVLRAVFIYNQDKETVLRDLRNQLADQLERSLCQAFANREGPVPFSVLAQYLAGAKISFLIWWLASEHHPYTPEQAATFFHRFQRATILDALTPLV